MLCILNPFRAFFVGIGRALKLLPYCCWGALDVSIATFSFLFFIFLIAAGRS